MAGYRKPDKFKTSMSNFRLALRNKGMAGRVGKFAWRDVEADVDGNVGGKYRAIWNIPADNVVAVYYPDRKFMRARMSSVYFMASQDLTDVVVPSLTLTMFRATFRNEAKEYYKAYLLEKNLQEITSKLDNVESIVIDTGMNQDRVSRYNIMVEIHRYALTHDREHKAYGEIANRLSEIAGQYEIALSRYWKLNIIR